MVFPHVHLICFAFSMLLGSVVWCLSLTLENSWPLLLQIFLLLHSLFFLWYFACVYATLFKIPHSSWMFCFYKFLFFSPSESYFMKFLLTYLQTYWLVLPCPVYSWVHQNNYLCYRVYNFFHFPLILSYSFHHSAYVTHLFCIVYISHHLLKY